jgi:DNA-binding phage protein
MPDAARRDAIAAAERLKATIEDTARVFAGHATAVDRLLVALQTPRPLRELLEAVDFHAEREAIAGAIDAFEAQRKEARIAAWRLLVAEGCSIGQIARMFSLSRQLVSRQLRDAGITVADD